MRSGFDIQAHPLLSEIFLWVHIYVTLEAACVAHNPGAIRGLANWSYNLISSLQGIACISRRVCEYLHFLLADEHGRLYLARHAEPYQSQRVRGRAVHDELG